MADFSNILTAGRQPKDRITNTLVNQSPNTSDIYQSLMQTFAQPVVRGGGGATFGEILNQVRGARIKEAMAGKQIEMDERRLGLQERQLAADEYANQLKALETNDKQSYQTFKDFSTRHNLNIEDEKTLFRAIEARPDKVDYRNLPAVLAEEASKAGIKTRQKAEKQDRTIYEVYDTSSGQRIGSFYKDDPRLDQYTGSGKYAITRTSVAAATPEALSKPVVKDLEENITQALDTLATAGRTYKQVKENPEFQLIDTRWRAGLAEAASKYKGVPILGDMAQKAASEYGIDTQTLRKYHVFRQDAIKLVNEHIRNMTGATLSKGEADRLLRQMPNPGSGLFDGDSPEVFTAKMENTMHDLALSIARWKTLRDRGLKDVNAIPLFEMSSMIDARKRDLIMANQALDDEDLKALVKRRIAEEYGIPEAFGDYI